MQPQNSQFDSDTRNRIQQARAAGVPENQIQQEAIVYQQKKAITQKPRSPQFEFLPVLGAVGGGILGGLVGGIPGAMIGAATGGGGGEYIRQKSKDQATNLPDIALQAALGAGGEGAGQIIGRGASAIAGKLGSTVEKSAAQSFTRATPSIIGKGISEHGLNLNALAPKYAPVGSSYEDLLGPVSARDLGGSLQVKLKDAEKLLQSSIKNIPIATVDELTTPLIALRTDLSKTIGNEEKIAQLDKLIKETQIKYKGGLTDRQLLDIKRAADEKFGKAVVEDTEGTINTQVQKLQGNTARGILKDRVSGTADALETQTEIYTLRPAIAKARAGGITASSGLSNIDVTRPATITKPILGNPKVSSTLMNAMQGLPQINLGQLGGGVGAAGASAVGTLATPGTPGDDVGQNVKGYGSQIPNNQQANNQLDHNGILPQLPSNINTMGQYLTGNSPQELYSAIQKAEAAGDKPTTALLRQWFKDETDYQKGQGGGKPLSGPNSVLLNKAQTAVKSLDRIKQVLTDNPALLIAAINPLDQSGRQINADIRSAIDVLGYFRTGAAITTDQRKDYIYMFPNALDNKETRDAKILRLREELQGYAEGISKSGGVDVLSLPSLQ